MRCVYRKTASTSRRLTGARASFGAAAPLSLCTRRAAPFCAFVSSVSWKVPRSSTQATRLRLKPNSLRETRGGWPVHTNRTACAFSTSL